MQQSCALWLFVQLSFLYAGGASLGDLPGYDDKTVFLPCDVSVAVQSSECLVG